MWKRQERQRNKEKNRQQRISNDKKWIKEIKEIKGARDCQRDKHNHIS